MHEYGQPPTVQTDPSGLITPERMREIVMKTPTAAAAMNATLDYVSGVNIAVRNVDPAMAPPRNKLRVLEAYMKQPNPQDTWRSFRRKIERDMFTLGWGAAEIEPNDAGGVANLWALDAARVRIDFDEHGAILGYDMLNVHGMPIRGADGTHAWTPDQIIFFPLDAQSTSLYPTSRIAQLFSCAVLEALMLQFIGARYTDSNVPYGLLDLGEITEGELLSAITLWNQQMQQLGVNKMMLTGSKGGMKFTPFADQLKDMHAPELLTAIRSQIMAILGVTVNELGEAQDVNKSNGFNLSYTFKKRAIEPILDTFTQTWNKRFVVETLGFGDLETYYEEIDSRDELLQAQIDKMYLDAGVWTINHVRNRKGLENTDGGDEPYLILGTNAVPIGMLQQFADAQLAALQGELQVMQLQLAQGLQSMQLQAQQAAAGGAAGGDSPATKLQPTASPPLVRGPQPPEKFTTIGGAGSSTPKLKLPKPTIDTKPPKSPTTTPARGGVQALRNAGVRKEDM